jgi:hypothetical protein
MKRTLSHIYLEAEKSKWTNQRKITVIQTFLLVCGVSSPGLVGEIINDANLIYFCKTNFCGTFIYTTQYFEKLCCSGRTYRSVFFIWKKN